MAPRTQMTGEAKGDAPRESRAADKDQVPAESPRTRRRIRRPPSSNFAPVCLPKSVYVRSCSGASEQLDGNDEDSEEFSRLITVDDVSIPGVWLAR